MVKRSRNDPINFVLNELIHHVESEYTLYMQKCLVLNDMLRNKDSSKFDALRIRPRYPQKIIRFQGCVPCVSYAREEYKNSLAKSHISFHKELIQALNIMTQRTA